jgi:ketosteroid isomerase-like protein
VGERDDFLDTVLPRLTAADTALHNGDPGPRKAIWSQNEPVTVFGAARTMTGPTEIAAGFDWLGTRFSNCASFEYEVVAADARGDLAYIVGTEYTTASVDGAEPQPYSLRVTTIFRREKGEWKVVHRHADPNPEVAGTQTQVERLRPGKATDQS